MKQLMIISLFFLISGSPIYICAQESKNFQQKSEYLSAAAEQLLVSFADEAFGPAVIQKMEISGNMTNADVWKIPGGADSVEVWCRGGFARDSWAFGVEAPDGQKALQMNRSQLIPNVWDGWMIAMFDFSAGHPLDPLEMEKVRNGERTIALDVFFEALDTEHTFQLLSEHEINDSDFGTKKLKGGVKFQMRLGKEAEFEGGNDWFIAREAYLTRTGAWQTLYFTMDEPGEPDLNYSIPADEVDRIWFIPNYSYKSGEENKFYIRNLRITDYPVDTEAPGFFSGFPSLIYPGATWSRWSVELDEPGKLYAIIQPSGAAEPTVEELSATTGIQVSRGALETMFNMDGLVPATAYTAFFLAEDTAGNRQNTISEVPFETVDAGQPAPAFTETYPEAYGIQDNAFNIRYKIDKPGKVYFKRMLASDSAPTEQQILEGTSRTIYDFQQEYSLYFSGLKDNSLYHTYFVLEDFESPVNRSDEPFILETRTNMAGEPHTPETGVHNPLVISEGGIYEDLKINSTDYNTPAVKITTTAPVTLRNCVISGSGDLIVGTVTKVQLTIENNYIWGRNPDIAGQQQGRSFTVSDPGYVVFRNNYTNQTGGVRIAGFSGNSDKSIIFEGNIHIDLTSLVSNGTGASGRAGYDISKDNGGALNRQMVILNNVNVPEGIPAPRIMYNLIVNNEYEEDNVSSTEDLINIFGSIGPSVDNPILVGRNFLRGAHGNEPFNPYRTFSGTGIVMDASNASGADFGNVELFENFISYAQNSGIGISSGHHIKVFGNKIINPLNGENGEQISGFYGNGMYVWAWKDDRPVANVEVFENDVHNYKSKEQEPGSSLGRNDWWFPDCSGTNSCHDNNKLDGPLDHDEVLKMYCEFYQVLTENGVSLGPDWGLGKEMAGFDFEGCSFSSVINDQNGVVGGIGIWPNPAGQILHVDTGNMEVNRYVILDITGRMVQENHPEQPIYQAQLPVGHLPEGVYILSASGKEKNFRKIFLKQ